MDNTLKIVAGVFIAILVACVVFLLVVPQPPAESLPAGVETSAQGNVTVYFFYGEECPHCHNVMPFIQNISKKYPEVDFRILETWHNETNQAISLSLHEKLGIQSAGVPEVIVTGNSTPLIGDRAIPEELEGVILEQLKKKQ
jgi:thiol-disulfide isomerase/thioredoxin